MSKKLSAQRVKYLTRNLFKIRDKMKKLESRDKRIRSQLLDHMGREKIDYLDSDDDRLLRIVPTSTHYDIEELEKLFAQKDRRTKAEKRKIPVGDLIMEKTYVEKFVNEEVLEQLVKKKVLNKKEAERVIKVTTGNPHLRASNVPKKEGK